MIYFQKNWGGGEWLNKMNSWKQPTKKRPNVLSNAISKFFVVKNPFKNDNEKQKDFM
jgi:hypothetical protein